MTNSTGKATAENESGTTITMKIITKVTIAR